MWVNKSVNPSQTSTRAAQATPPRMKPGTVYAAGRVTHTALRADLRRNGSEWQSLPPRAGRGKHLAKPVPQTTLGSLAQAPAGLFVASDRTAQARFCPSGSIPAARSRGIATRTRRRCGAPCCAPAAPERHPALASEREGTGPCFTGPVPWWGSIDACELPFLFSPSEPPPALGKSPVPVVRQPAALSRHKRPPEKMDGHLFHVRRNPGLSHPCHAPFTGLGPFG